MSKIRVLVVDDAVVIRRIVGDVLGGTTDIEVAATAANGKIALAKIPQINPDLVTLDVEMPEMDGLTTVREIRKLYPNLPVIMFSTLTSRGASAALEALAGGASDYVTKPANVGSVAVAMERIREELIPKIRSLCAKAVPQSAPIALPAKRSTSLPPKRGAGQLEIVVIGVSTGGPNALAEVIPALPADLPVPILIVQHMPPVFTKVLADRLNQKSPLTVKEAEHGERVKAGTVYLAPGDFHMTVEKNPAGRFIRLNQETPENSCRPAVDVLFRSAAAADGPNVLAAVLTGMGRDGFRGAEVVRETGGTVIVQDQATSVVWGMPGMVARAGLADEQVPLSQIAANITRRVCDRRPSNTRPTAA